jgi:transcriptional repressor NrdR
VNCPFCGNQEDKVIDSRASKDGREIRRRRECEGCQRRFTTYERVEESMPLVVKRDGRREPFDRNKIEHGLMFAVAKRPVSQEQVKAMAAEVETEISELGVSEIQSREIGERVLPRLRALDQVSYVRFASIYRDFRDIEEFARELEALREDALALPKRRRDTEDDVSDGVAGGLDEVDRTGETPLLDEVDLVALDRG